MAEDPALRDFQQALLVRRVVARHVEGKAFPSDKALQNYLTQHPGADKSKHWVKGDETPAEYEERKKRLESGKPREFKDETEEEYAARKKKMEKSKKDEAAKKDKEKAKEKSEFKDETPAEYEERKKRLESGKPREFKDETEAEYKARLKRLKEREKK